MNETIELMKTRRSIRSYSDQPVTQEELDQVLEAGTWAATGRGLQSPIIIAVTDKSLRDRISALNARIMGASEGVDPFYGAPVILIVLAKKEVPTAVYDGSLVIGNLMLAAHSLGLGSCWIHRAKEEFELPEGQELLRSLGIEEEYIGVGHVALGHIAGEYPGEKPRKDGWIYRV